MKFDVIAGNPPYNKSRGEERDGKPQGQGAVLWDAFVVKSLDLLKDGGYLCYVHPQLWRKPEQEMWSLMTSHQIHHLDIHGEDDGRKTFGVGTRYDWYILQKIAVKGATTVRSEDGVISKIDLREWNFLPNYMIDVIKSVMAIGTEERCELIYSTAYHTQKEYTSDTKDSKFKYPCVHSLNSEENGGMVCRYSREKKTDHFGIPKVILTQARYQRPLNDYKGDYGMTENVFGIAISSKREGDLIVSAINTPKFQEIIRATKWGNFRTDYKMFRAFKKDFWKQFMDENGNELK